MQKYISKEKFDNALDSLCEINHRAIESKLAKAVAPPDLETLLTATDKDIQPLLKQYCNKSGMELRNLDLHYLQQLVAIHGKEKAVELLRIDAVSQYCSIWLHTDSASLNKLMIYDIAGYFVYAASHIFHHDIIRKTNLSKMPPHSPVGKESTEETEIKDFLKDFPQQDKPQDFTWSEIPESADIRYFNLQDKIIARRNCELYLDDVRVTEANELLRKFLGLAKPDKVANFVQFSFSHLHEITDTQENFNRFIDELKQAIKSLFYKHYKLIKKRRAEYYTVKLRNANVSYADIAAIKAAFNGLTNFHQQPKIRNQSKQESIMFDLRGFWDSETERDDTKINLRGIGNSVSFDASKQKLDITGKPVNKFKAKKGLRLNVCKKELRGIINEQ